jgi:hypothetical protein
MDNNSYSIKNTITVVIHNKSSLLLKIIFKNTQTLKLFTENMKTEIIYKRYKKCKTIPFGLEILDLVN